MFARDGPAGDHPGHRQHRASAGVDVRNTGRYTKGATLTRTFISASIIGDHTTRLQAAAKSSSMQQNT